jgi:aspartate aminotransferase
VSTTSPVQQIAARVGSISDTTRLFFDFIREFRFDEMDADPEVGNFAFGNPQEMPLPGFVDALHRAVEPRDKDWFAYKRSEPEAQEIVAAALRDELGIPFEPADIAMTSGAFGALATAIQLTVDPGDEVIISLPPWFFYESMIAAAGGVTIKVPVDRETFDPDLAAIEAAITPRTRAIIVNTPNNPTGRIYPPETLERLATILAEASSRNGRPVYLISDEPYRRIRFDGAPFHSPLAFYPFALMTYSYGKILLTPGQRIGYLAMPPTMPNREVMRGAIEAVQFAAGWLFPNAILQHAIAELEMLSIDLDHLKRKRDRMVTALREIGYDVHAPESTFYLLPRSPWEDDMAFARELAARKVLVLPGAVTEFPGFFRISLTASEAMIERALPRFADAFRHARENPEPSVVR